MIDKIPCAREACRVQFFCYNFTLMLEGWGSWTKQRSLRKQPWIAVDGRLKEAVHVLVKANPHPPSKNAQSGGVAVAGG
jgi:hypothetical protein